MIPQARDEEICVFLKNTGLATTSQIEKVFFSHCKYSGNVVRRRMLKLFNAGLVKRYQADAASEFIYWLEGKKPSQVDHRLLVTDIYVAVRTMKNGYIENWQREPQLEGLRPDAFLKFIIPENGRKRQCNRFFEVERWTGNPFNQEKYEKYYEGGSWKSLAITSFPKVVIVTDKKIAINETRNGIVYTVLATDLKNIQSVF
jgi:DNA-binding Lrp family transcriptional regulator